MDKCTQPNCEKPVHSKGLCDGHYHAQPHIQAKRRARYKPETKEARINRKQAHLKRMADPKYRQNLLARARAKNQADRMLVLLYYSNGKIKCACCGEKEPIFLSIDHINAGGRRHREQIKKEGYTVLYKYLKAKNYPPGALHLKAFLHPKSDFLHL